MDSSQERPLAFSLICYIILLRNGVRPTQRPLPHCRSHPQIHLQARRQFLPRHSLAGLSQTTQDQTADQPQDQRVTHPGIARRTTALRGLGGGTRAGHRADPRGRVPVGLPPAREEGEGRNGRPPQTVLAQRQQPASAP
jgi:hypothetical protein